MDIKIEGVEATEFDKLYFYIAVALIAGLPKTINRILSKEVKISFLAALGELLSILSISITVGSLCLHFKFGFWESICFSSLLAHFGTRSFFLMGKLFFKNTPIAQVLEEVEDENKPLV